MIIGGVNNNFTNDFTNRPWVREELISQKHLKCFFCYSRRVNKKNYENFTLSVQIHFVVVFCHVLSN